ncbi:MAG: recombinase RecT [Sulfuritalea sp.]|nr:recombinase RecT [Sulfuritalea sp.]
MARSALTAFRTTPKLADCDPRSVFAAVIQSSQMGLEVGLMGEARLVPFGTQCQLIPGYGSEWKLLLAIRLVQDIYAHEVRLKDTFSLKLGLARDLRHEPLTAEGGFPASDEERGEIAGFYAVAVFKDGSRTFVAMGRKEVEKIRDGSRGYQAAKKYKKESIWDSDFGSMGLKTAIRRICKFLPKSPEMAAALALDAAAVLGKDQNLNLNEVIEELHPPIIDDDERDRGTRYRRTRRQVHPKHRAGRQTEGRDGCGHWHGASGAAAESGKQEPQVEHQRQA